jgi:hypothetical protein
LRKHQSKRQLKDYLLQYSANYNQLTLCLDKGPDKLHLIIKSPDSMKRLSRPKVLPFGGWFSTSCCKGTCYRF